MAMAGKRKREREADLFDDIDSRARVYLAEGRLTVVYVDGGYIGAVCAGQSGTHHLGFDPQRGWWCSCGTPGDCAHLTALRMVTNPQG